MPFTEEQRAERRKGIGGSEIAAVVGLSKWQSAQQVWEEKMGLLDPPEVNFNMERGLFLEDGIIKWLAHRTGLPMVPNSTTMFSDRHQLCYATPDGHVLEKAEPQAAAIAVVEVKSPGLGTSADWADPLTMPDGIPLYYLPQVMWEMEANGLREHNAIVAALIGGDIRKFSIPFNDEMVMLLWGKAEEFWGYVERQEPPPHDHTEKSAEWVRNFFKQRQDNLVELSGQEELDMLKLATRFKNTEKSIKELEATKKDVRAQMQDFIRDRAGMKGNGWKATWKEDKQGRIGYKKVVEDMQVPAATLENFRSKPSRRFLVNLGKEK